MTDEEAIKAHEESRVAALPKVPPPSRDDRVQLFGGPYDFKVMPRPSGGRLLLVHTDSSFVRHYLIYEESPAEAFRPFRLKAMATTAELEELIVLRDRHERR